MVKNVLEYAREGQLPRESICQGHIPLGIWRTAGQPQPEKVAMDAAADIQRCRTEGQLAAIPDESQRSGMTGPADEALPYSIDRIGWRRAFHDLTVQIGIGSGHVQPSSWHGLHNQLRAVRFGLTEIDIGTFSKAFSCERDHVAKAIVEPIHFNFCVVIPQPLFYAEVKAARALRPKMTISQKRRFWTEGLGEVGLLDAQSKVKLQLGRPEGAGALPQQVRKGTSRDYRLSEAAVAFHTHSVRKNKSPKHDLVLECAS